MSEQWNGRPPNPESDAWHFVAQRTDGVEYVRRWHSSLQRWELSNGALVPAHWVSEVWSYLGPCLTPAEVAARVAETRREALKGMSDSG
jgi:hypothetical protein